MGTHRYVWLPSSGVWACVPQSSSDAAGATSSGQGASSSCYSDRGVNSLFVENREGKNGTASSPSRFRKGGCTVLEGACGRGCGDEEAVDSGTGFRVSSKQHGMESNSSKLDLFDSEEKRSRWRGSRRFTTSLAMEESVEEGIGGDDEGACISHHPMCAICLGNIEEAEGAVLQWCMHQFCTHCIEEWSRVRRVCPLCKAEFSGWYYKVQSNSQFQERILAPSVKDTNSQFSPGDGGVSHSITRSRSLLSSRNPDGGRGRRPFPLRQQTVLREVPNRSQAAGRLVPYPTQRSFDVPRRYRDAQATRAHEEESAARAMRWRASIYSKGLKAHPFKIQRLSSCTQGTIQSLDDRARAERRLEPWIRRELQVLLRDSKPDLLVRLVIGVWFGLHHESTDTSPGKGSPVRRAIASCNRSRIATTSEDSKEKAVKELERYLGDKAGLFWHELQCFAQSPFTMKAYDTVVVYIRTGTSEISNYIQEERSLIQDDTGDLRCQIDGTTSRRTHIPLELGYHREDYVHMENHDKNVRARRHTHPQNSADSIQDSLGLHPHEHTMLSTPRLRSVLERDTQFDQPKKRLRMDVPQGADDRWQMSSG